MSGMIAQSPFARAAAGPVGAADDVAAARVAPAADPAEGTGVVPRPEPVLHEEESRTIAADAAISRLSASLLNRACDPRTLRAASSGMLDAHKLCRFHLTRGRNRVDEADSGRVVLLFDDCRLKRTPLERLDDAPMKVLEGNLGRLILANEPGHVLGLAGVVLLPEGAGNLEISRHHYPGQRPVHSAGPRTRGALDAPVRVEQLGVLAHVPDVALVILRE